MREQAPFVVMAKAAGPICDLDCGYCYYLDKKELFPRGERFRMRPEVLSAYVAARIAASPGPNATGIRTKPGPGQTAHGYRE